VINAQAEKAATTLHASCREIELLEWAESEEKSHHETRVHH